MCKGGTGFSLYSELGEYLKVAIHYCSSYTWPSVSTSLSNMGAFRSVSQSTLCSEHLPDSECLCLCCTEKANERRLCVCACVSECVLLSEHTRLFVCIHVPACDIQHNCVDSNGPWEVSPSELRFEMKTCLFPAGILCLRYIIVRVGVMCKGGRVSWIRWAL